MVATVACQLPKPRGAKIQAMVLPMLARMEWLLSSTMPKAPFSKPKPWRNHNTMVDSRITVPARLMKDQPRSHMDRSTLPTEGAW